MRLTAESRCSMTDAVAGAVERAPQKYRITDWSRRRFRVVEFG
jgi:flavin-binding protein dodecin